MVNIITKFIKEPESLTLTVFLRKAGEGGKERSGIR